MRSKSLVVLIAVAVMGVSWTAMAKGGGGGGGSMAMHSHGHGHFVHHSRRNPVFLGGWGWGWPYYDSGYGNNTVVVAYPQATPQAANVTGSIAATPCHWNSETFTVPSSAGGNRPVEVVSCR
jgi:hypothetical protein